MRRLKLLLWTTRRPPRSPDVCHFINRSVSRCKVATAKRCTGTLAISRSCHRTESHFSPFSLYYSSGSEVRFRWRNLSLAMSGSTRATGRLMELP
ncbi:hypothetical protein OPV22_029898 [Ensete ventricosum]|uniref:Secreted protein n=1 Tax=Ensete ventricosum TaxID=4639 RepID=A0AAV8QCL6_ENSVE|nr:hypothetical protein OPV22_029898 [Ensete ventricosum]